MSGGRSCPQLRVACRVSSGQTGAAIPRWPHSRKNSLQMPPRSKLVIPAWSSRPQAQHFRVARPPPHSFPSSWNRGRRHRGTVCRQIQKLCPLKDAVTGPMSHHFSMGNSGANSTSITSLLSEALRWPSWDLREESNPSSFRASGLMPWD